VAEDELLKAADAKSVSNLFFGMDGKSLSEPQIGPGGVMSPPPPGRIPQQDWNSLFVPGDQPKTWRLNVPKSAPQPGVKVDFRRAENQPGEGLIETPVSGTTQKVYLHASAGVTNADIAEARAALDSQQKPVVEITFTEEGAKKMAKLTAEHQNKPLAILVDGKVVCAPVLRATISQKAQITGNFTQEEVDRIVRGINGR
jgi:hypothetical protein